MHQATRWIAVAVVCCLPGLASAHTGGPLDADGCHADHRTGSYHCHRGAAAGYTFSDRAAMQQAVRTGKFPEKSVDEEGFFSKLWPWGKKHEDEPAAAKGVSGETGETGKTGAAAAPAAAVPAKQREFEERLKVLQGLYEMGLITKEEYEEKRKAVLEQL